MRRLDWPERLVACVERAERTPFAWGRHDCVLWACDVVRALTGTDPARSFRGTYATARGAARVVLEIGADFRAAVARVCADHGYAPIAPALAQRGDLVLVPSGLAAWPESLGICLGRDAMTTGARGLVRLPMRQALAAWRVA